MMGVSEVSSKLERCNANLETVELINFDLGEVRKLFESYGDRQLAKKSGPNMRHTAMNEKCS